MNGPQETAAPRKIALPQGVHMISGATYEDKFATMWKYYAQRPMHRALYYHQQLTLFIEADDMKTAEIAQTEAANRCLSVAAIMRGDQSLCQLVAVDNERLKTPLNIQLNLNPSHP